MLNFKFLSLHSIPKLFFLILLFFLLIKTTQATSTSKSTTTPWLPPNNARSVPSWVQPLLPHRNGTGTIKDEMKCYSLPFGAIGFISHILTYWQILCLYHLRSPFLPWIELSHRWWDMGLAILTLVVTPTISVFTIVRCTMRWEFVLIAVWVGMMSATVGVWTFVTVKKLDKRVQDLDELLDFAYEQTHQGDEHYGSLWENMALHLKPENMGTDKYHAQKHWLLIYLFAVLIGSPGLFSLVVKTWPLYKPIRSVTYAFSAIALIWIVFELCIKLYFGLWLGARANREAVFIFLKAEPTSLRKFQYYWGSFLMITVTTLMHGGFVMTVLFAFYVDWVLGGVPSKDVSALYWIFFAAKRLTMLSG
ncbi:hypothetical protein GQ43DRAFT_159699 [Delitschia confertaspora ATCC 74209]|uniref:Uncharacterized protein n=1 Tax=Delitschia confertaspora ATCC 74209 TaxID=1513339 RepID=A0A9P4JZ92_9PLEO|nr:hypothetical protein GQ43DRAFT_159699 [Delitschia confertaspora ATCC 74209]